MSLPTPIRPAPTLNEQERKHIEGQEYLRQIQAEYARKVAADREIQKANNLIDPSLPLDVKKVMRQIFYKLNGVHGAAEFYANNPEHRARFYEALFSLESQTLPLPKNV